MDVVCGETTFSIQIGKKYIRERGIDLPMMNMPVVQKSMECIASVVPEVRGPKQDVFEGGLAMMVKCWRKTEVACLSCLARAQCIWRSGWPGSKAMIGIRVRVVDFLPVPDLLPFQSSSCRYTTHHGDDDE